MAMVLSLTRCAGGGAWPASMALARALVLRAVPLLALPCEPVDDAVLGDHVEGEAAEASQEGAVGFAAVAVDGAGGGGGEGFLPGSAPAGRGSHRATPSAVLIASRISSANSPAGSCSSPAPSRAPAPAPRSSLRTPSPATPPRGAGLPCHRAWSAACARAQRSLLPSRRGRPASSRVDPLALSAL